MNLVRTAVAASLVFAVGQAAAQPAGTSAGTSVVTIVKDNAVLISGVDPIDFGNPSALTAANNSQSDDVCVFSSTGGYTVAASSTQGFALTDANVAGTSIAYTVDWSAATAPAVPGGPAGALTDATLATAGAPVTVSTSYAGDRNDTDCATNGDNATFTVTLEASDYNQAPAGTYTDTLTLTVTPV